jgi:hypothetical protein
MKRLVASLVAAVALAASVPAQAMETDRAVSCLDPGQLKAYLDSAFREAPIATGRLENGNRVEFYASRQGTWTMVEMTGDGYGCVASHGQGLQVQKTRSALRPAS